MKRVLLAEDDLSLAKGLRQALEGEGYEVLLARNGIEAMEQLQFDPHIVILDLMMPEMNGFEFITECRRQGRKLPILVLSARSQTQDKIRGLDLGADDYLVKPFDLGELMARLRRLCKSATENKRHFGEWTYDFELQQLTRNGELAILSAKERKLLELFLSRPGQLWSREQIITRVWGMDYDGTDRTVDNLILQLRKKIGPEWILSERGEGYRFHDKSVTSR